MTNLVPWDLWGQSSGYLAVSGESHYERELRRVLGGAVPAGGREVLRDALLVPDPKNRYDRHAVKVMIDGMQVGFVPADRCQAYGPTLEHLERHGRVARVQARVRGYMFSDFDDRGRERPRLGASVSLALADAHLLMPLTAQPPGPGVEVPEGRRQKVNVNQDEISYLAQWTRPEGSAWVHTSLVRVVDTATRTPRELVAVWVGDREVGRLTPAMSRNFLPLLSLTQERRLSCVARGLLTGNRVHCELSIAAAKSSELAADWLEAHIYAVPIPTPPDAGMMGTASDAIDEERSRPEGFYPDPQEVADLRYWDGCAWTSRIRMNPR